VTFSQQGGLETVVRPIAPVGLNLRRVVAATDLAAGVAAGGMGVREVRAELARIRAIAGPRAWQVIVAATLGSAAFSQTMTPDLQLAPIAGSAALAGQSLRLLCQRRGLPRLAATAACTLLSALIGTAALRLGLSTAPGPTLIASIIYAAPGMLLINGFIDLTNERYLFAGLQRLLHAGLLFLVMTLSVFVADALL
ncbi:MAG: threonine/serine exporter family protein, partial [Phenylobacterium sp.]